MHADLTRAWPEEIETILLDCIDRRAAFNAVFKRHNYNDDLIQHALTTLGEVGSDRAHSALRTLSDDPEFGAIAVTTLVALQRRGIGIV